MLANDVKSSEQRVFNLDAVCVQVTLLLIASCEAICSLQLLQQLPSLYEIHSLCSDYKTTSAAACSSSSNSASTSFSNSNSSNSSCKQQ
jgi:hypothetical protein